jgi:Rrf2 family transcriptional regulator, cysteine metabolism repressor
LSLISSKGIYGLEALYTLSKYNPKQPISIKDISSKTNISQKYLEQIFNKLLHSNIIKSIRGPKGGYILNKSPKDILVKDILNILEDDIKIINNTKINDPILDIFLNKISIDIKNLFNINLDEINKYSEKYNQNLHYNI